MNYGTRLKTARKAKSLTQQQLSDLSGVPQGTISKIERGDQEASTYDTVLAETLEISAIWLSKGKGNMQAHETGHSRSSVLGNYLKGEADNGVPANENDIQGVQEESAHYSKDDIDLLNRIKELSPADQARLEGIINVLNAKLDKETG